MVIKRWGVMIKLKAYFERMSFRWRMRFGTVFVIFLVAGLGVTVSIFRQADNQIRAMNDLGSYVALNLSKNSELGILSEEAANLEQPLNAVLSDEQVFGAFVYTANGKLVGNMHRQEYQLTSVNDKQQLELIKAAGKDVIILETRTAAGRALRSYLAAVFVERISEDEDDVFGVESDGGKFYGFVRVDMSLAHLKAKKTATLRENLFLMPFYIVIGIVFSMVAESRISRPLKNLKNAAKAMANGDFTNKINVATTDEIGALAETFNEMSSKLEKNITKLNDSNEQLGKANKELNDFTYIVSHDLQEPLRKVHSFGQFLLEDCYDQLSKDGKDYISRMQKASVKMKLLIQDLLKLSRIGTDEELFKAVDTGEVVAIAIDDLSVAIGESGAEVVVGNLPTVHGQKVLLTQLFENLIGNALKYRSADRTPIIEIDAEVKDDQATFTIKDNGIGIEDRFKEKIFGVFQRLHTTEYSGTGIGLALCKKIVKRHGGKIWMDSVFGEGTTFYFTLKTAKINKRTIQNGKEIEREYTNSVG